jgi:hypothetical protein
MARIPDRFRILANRSITTGRTLVRGKRSLKPVGPQLYSALRLGAFGTLAKLELRSLLEVYGTVGGGGRFLSKISGCIQPIL